MNHPWNEEQAKFDVRNRFLNPKEYFYDEAAGPSPPALLGPSDSLFVRPAAANPRAANPPRPPRPPRPPPRWNGSPRDSRSVARVTCGTVSFSFCTCKSIAISNQKKKGSNHLRMLREPSIHRFFVAKLDVCNFLAAARETRGVVDTCDLFQQGVSNVEKWRRKTYPVLGRPEEFSNLSFVRADAHPHKDGIGISSGLRALWCPSTSTPIRQRRLQVIWLCASS